MVGCKLRDVLRITSVTFVSHIGRIEILGSTRKIEKYTGVNPKKPLCRFPKFAINAKYIKILLQYKLPFKLKLCYIYIFGLRDKQFFDKLIRNCAFELSAIKLAIPSSSTTLLIQHGDAIQHRRPCMVRYFDFRAFLRK